MTATRPYTFSTRLTDKEGDAIKRAAIFEGRTASALARIILVQWLIQRKMIKESSR